MFGEQTTHWLPQSRSLVTSGSLAIPDLVDSTCESDEAVRVEPCIDPLPAVFCSVVHSRARFRGRRDLFASDQLERARHEHQQVHLRGVYGMIVRLQYSVVKGIWIFIVTNIFV